MNVRDLTLRIRSLLMPARVERDLDDELAFHIEREAQQLIAEGMNPEDARWQARARFGSATVVADECRDERGTAVFDNTMRDIHYALRTFARAPLTSLTIVITVAVGLGAVAVLFTILNTFIFRVDAVPNVHEMYAVEKPQLPDGVPSLFPRRQFDLMRAETNVFTDIYAVVSDIDLRIEGKTVAAAAVTGNFFSVVGVPAAMGRVITPADDDRAGGHAVIVLSNKGWNRRFDRDPHVVGKTVLIREVPFEIIGVTPPGFRGLDVGGPDLWTPMSQIASLVPSRRGVEDDTGVDVVGRLKPGVSPASARSQLAAWLSNQPDNTAQSSNVAEQHAIHIDVVRRDGTLKQPMEAIAVFIPLFVAFGLILMIGCANVANLLLARGVARQREIGIRLSLGAPRRRIVRQLMTESLLLAMVASAVGYLVSRVALEATIYAVMRAMPVDLGDVNLNVPAADWRVALFLIVAAVASTAFFALMPALQATRIDPVRTLRGELVKEARPGRARDVLIGVQVFASALLLICAGIFLRSSFASVTYDPGFRTADTIMITLINEPTRAAMLRQIAAEPAIIAYAAARPGMLEQRAAFADTGDGKQNASYKFVSGSYFDVMGIPIVRGRAFTPSESDTAAVVIVSETTARTLFPNRDAIGATFHLEADTTSITQPNDEPPLSARTVTVVGISRDVKGFRITDVKDAGIFVPTRVDVPHTAVMARVNGVPDLVRQTLLDHLTRIDPNMGMIVMMKTVARLDTFFLTIAFWISLVLGLLALLLTVSGLFSVLSYLVEQRTREIGVRMALGASSQSVTRLMLSQTIPPVLCGLIAGGGLAATLATVLLSTPFGEFISQIVHVADPVAYATSLLVIVAACVAAAWLPATRASRLDPMRTLRQE